MSTLSDLTFFIVTPSFNQATFLPTTVKSVISQKNVEVRYAVIDGGSSDGSKHILEKLPKDVFWISEKDYGQVDAINKGIQHFKSIIQKEKINTQNIIFAYLNSDDYYLSRDSLQKIESAFLANPDKSWVVADALIVDENGNQIQNIIRMYKIVSRKVFGARVLTVLNPIPQPATFIRWKALEKVGEFNQHLRYAMDYEYWLRLLKHVGEPLFLFSTVSAFRIHNQSKGGIQFENQFKEELVIAERFGVTGVLYFLHSAHSWLITTVYKFLK